MGLAKEILYTGRTVSAAEALRIGLVNQVVPPEKLLDEAMDLARRLVLYSGATLGCLKAAVNRGAGLDLEHSLDVEKDLFSLCFATRDHAEGCAAFLEKRTPVFTNS
jgi:enoyl-CoA hydratase